jgi:hypothetical protein
MSGKNYNRMEVSGEIIDIYPSVGFLVRKDFYTYLIVDNFQAGEKQFTHHLESIPPEFAGLTLSKRTVLFWLNGVGTAKSVLFGKEIREKRLIDPMSREGLLLPVKLNPIISAFSGMNLYKGDILDFYLEFGTLPGERDRGHEAPLPYIAMNKNESKRQTDIWHLERAKLNNVGIDIHGSYKYTFNECGKMLVVTLHGEEISTIHFSESSVHNTPYSSPAPSFVLKGTVDSIARLDIAEDKFNLTYLSTDKLHEGIESAYWHMRRLRDQGGFATNMSFLKAMLWTDSAWDEIQARREEEEDL